MLNSDQNKVLQRQCADFINSIGIPGVIIFGYEEEDGKIMFIRSSNKAMHPHKVVKIITFAANDAAMALL